jgi:peroxiredoxin
MSQDRGWKTISILLIISNAVLILCLCAMAVVFLAGIGLVVFETNYTSGISSSQAVTVQVGQPAPAFQLTGLDGKTVSLQQYSGQPILINFWATWCGPCKDEMPLIAERYLQYQPDLIVLAIEEGESLSDVKKFSEENNLPFLILLDEAIEIGNLYGIDAYPTTFFVDGNGVVQAVEIGSMDSNTIDQDLLLVGVP